MNSTQLTMLGTGLRATSEILEARIAHKSAHLGPTRQKLAGCLAVTGACDSLFCLLRMRGKDVPQWALIPLRCTVIYYAAQKTSGPFLWGIILSQIAACATALLGDEDSYRTTAINLFETGARMQTIHLMARGRF